MVAVQLKYLNGEYADAKAALDDVASQVAGASGLPIAE
jgi:lactose/L-arabinose transport system substrate-binding protein